MFRIFKQLDVRNRAYVVDLKGNKLFYGTLYQCQKFISYMKGEEPNAENRQRDPASGRYMRS